MFSFNYNRILNSSDEYQLIFWGNLVWVFFHTSYSSTENQKRNQTNHSLFSTKISFGRIAVKVIKKLSDLGNFWPPICPDPSLKRDNWYLHLNLKMHFQKSLQTFEMLLMGSYLKGFYKVSQIKENTKNSLCIKNKKFKMVTFIFPRIPKICLHMEDQAKFTQGLGSWIAGYQTVNPQLTHMMRTQRHKEW